MLHLCYCYGLWIDVLLSSVKEIKNLINKGMSNLLVRKTHLPKFWLVQVWEIRLQVSFWGAPTHAHIAEFYNFLLQLKIQVWKQKRVAFLLIYFWTELWRFKVKEFMLIVEQKAKLQRSWQAIFLSATKIGKNTTSILDYYFSWKITLN